MIVNLIKLLPALPTTQITDF